MFAKIIVFINSLGNITAVELFRVLFTEANRSLNIYIIHTDKTTRHNYKIKRTH